MNGFFDKPFVLDRLFPHGAPPLNEFNALEPIQTNADQCVKCGACLPVCPTYRIAQNESESPRGRMVIAGWIAESIARENLAREPFDPASEPRLPNPSLSKTSISANTIAHLDHCLQCGQCERVCPSKVRVVETMRAVRALPSARSTRPIQQRWMQGALSIVIGRVQLLRALMIMVRWPVFEFFNAARARWARGLQVARVMSAEQVHASVERPRHAKPLAGLNASNTSTNEVVLFTGCTGLAMERDTIAAAQNLAQRCGTTLDFLDVCCGALQAHNGDFKRAELQAARASTCIANHQSPTVLTMASGCHTQVQSLLPTHSNALDVTTWAARLLSASHGTLQSTRTVAWLIPCTQRGQANDIVTTRELLKQVNGLTVVELPEQLRCCGAGGMAFLQHIDTTDALADEHIRLIQVAKADLVITANIGCRMHLAAALRRAKMDIEVWHPVRLLSESMRNTSHHHG